MKERPASSGPQPQKAPAVASNNLPPKDLEVLDAEASELREDEIVMINEPLPPGGLNIRGSNKTSSDNI